jgi:hypothetical protein
MWHAYPESKGSSPITGLTLLWGHSVSQVVSRLPLTSESQVRSRVNPCGICDRQSGTGIGFSRSSSVLPLQYHYTGVFRTHIRG